MSKNLAGVTRRALHVSCVPETAVRPYEDLPSLPRGLPLVGNFLKLGAKPHGFERASENMKLLSAKYDPLGLGLLRMESKMVNPTGQGRIVMVSDPEEVQAIYQSEGKYPFRGEGFNVIKNWRQSRPDIFKETTGVLVENFEEWARVRSLIQQDMMRPKSAMFYINQLQEVGQDFINYCRRRRDKNGIMPEDHVSDLYKFGFESIAVVALDTRLGALDEKVASGTEDVLLAMADIINLFPDLMMGFPVWKISPKLSPKYQRMERGADIVAGYVKVSGLFDAHLFKIREQSQSLTSLY